MTWDRWLYFLSKGRRAEDFFTLKIRRLRPGANPQTWVPKASTLPLDHWSHLYLIFTLSIFPSVLHTHLFIYHQSNILLARERIINNTLLFLTLSDALRSVWHETSILLFNPYSVAKAIKPLRHIVVRPSIWPSQCLQHRGAINFTWGLIKLVRAISVG
jgi:hypothetical protein